MADKLIINCSNNEITEQLFTPEEITQRELEHQMQQEQELMGSLKPSEKDALMAEIELNTINLLLEMGVF